MKRLKKKAEPRQKMINLDHSKLSDQNVRRLFCEEVVTNMGSATHTYPTLAETVKKASLTTLPKKEHAQPIDVIYITR